MVLKKYHIPVNAPVITPEARKFVSNCLRTGWISSAGPYVNQFEEAFARYVGRRYGVAVSSGTAALHCALIALGLGPGDEVIVPAFTMISTLFSIMYTGARPVFVDCEPDTFTLDPGQLARAVTRRTRAIMPVHIFGHAADMDPVQALARRHGLFVIEDAAEAHGGLYKGKRCGSMGDLSAFSFYANKIITTGEGGMALTDNRRLAERMRKARDLFHSPKKRFIHEELGYTYRMTNLQAAVGLGQLKHLNAFIAKKQWMAKRYALQLKGVPGLRLPVTRPHVRNVFWMYAVLVEPRAFGMGRDALRAALGRGGIDTRDFFYPPDEQPAIRKVFGTVGRFPVTRDISRRGLYLPSGLAITDAEIDHVCRTVVKIQRRVRERSPRPR